MRAGSQGQGDAGAPRRVLLVAVGTRGDVVPAVRLGAALRERGDDVLVAVLADGAPDVERAGLRPVVVGPPAPEAMWWRTRGARSLALRHPGAMYLQTRTRLARQADGIAAALAPLVAPRGTAGGAGADLVVCGLATAGLVPVLLGAGVPSRLVLHAPLLPHAGGTSAWRRGISEVLPPLVETSRQALLWSLTQGLSSAVARALPRATPRGGAPAPVPPHVRRALAVPLLATSRVLDPEPSPRVVQTGWWADPGPVRPLPPALSAWLDRHPGAVLLSVGSGTQPDPEDQVDRLARVAELAGVPAVVQVHGARPGPRRPGGAPGGGDPRGGETRGGATIVVTDVDHRALLPRLRAVVHHGGSGTTHVATAAGLPQLVVPHLGDQPHYGRQVGRIGLGPRAVPRTRASVPVLAAGLRELLHDQAYRRAATAAAGRMAGEDGLSRAVDELDVPAATGVPGAPTAGGVGAR